MVVIEPAALPEPSTITTASPPFPIGFPAASRAVSVTVEPAHTGTVVGDAVTTEVAGDIGPGVTVIDGAVDVTVAPPIVAVMVRGVPAVVPVSVAEYVPSLWSRTLPIVAALVPEFAPNANVTAAPPVVSPFEASSRNVSVTVVVLPDAIDDWDSESVDWRSDGGPGVTLKVGNGVVSVLPAILAVTILADPATVPVIVAVYVPPPSSAVGLTVPVLVPDPVREMTTAAPPDVRFCPAAFLA